jgi:hypothetical protein
VEVIGSDLTVYGLKTFYNEAPEEISLKKLKVSMKVHGAAKSFITQVPGSPR